MPSAKHTGHALNRLVVTEKETIPLPAAWRERGRPPQPPGPIRYVIAMVSGALAASLDDTQNMNAWLTPSVENPTVLQPSV